MRVQTIGALERPNVLTIRGLGESTPSVFTAEGFSASHAAHPWAWTLGSFALGWAGGYLAWVAIGRAMRRR